MWILMLIKYDVEKRYSTSNDHSEKPLPMGDSWKLLGVIKNELVGVERFKKMELRRKMYYYILNDDKVEKGVNKPKK